MSQKHTALLDEVLDPGANFMNEDLRAVLHALRVEQQTSQQMSMLRLEATEKLISDHVKACEKRSEQLDTLIELVSAMQGSMKMANWMKSFLVWVTGVAGSIYTLYKMWKP